MHPALALERNPPPAASPRRVALSQPSGSTNFPAIQVRRLTRVFNTYKKQPGLAAALRGLLHRRIEQTFAAREVTFEVAEGEMVGFLGPNGAGKTTTLKMLAGLLHPTSGSATVLGYVPWERHRAYQRQVALLLGQKNQLWWDLPARDSLQLNSKIYGLTQSIFERRVCQLSEMLLVTDKLGVMVRELSLGERMKMELIASLLHDPKALFLDEPTIGLDVVSQKIVREFLRDYNATHKTTIVLTSHYMADIQSLCRRVIIIDRGQICFDGALSEIMERFANFKFIEVTTESEVSHLVLAKILRSSTLIEQGARRLRFKVHREHVAAACKVICNQLPIKDISIQDLPAEDIFRVMFGSRATAQEGPYVEPPAWD
jgi:ABC-2 type transport system ATP-binding protein